MVRPSDAKLMQQTIDAVFYLKDGKGTTGASIEDYVLENTKSAKKPSEIKREVQRALKHAVNASLLKVNNGRYKPLLVLKPFCVRPKKSNNEATKNVNRKRSDSVFDLINQTKVKDRGAAKSKKKGNRSLTRAQISRKQKATRKRKAGETALKLNKKKLKSDQPKRGGQIIKVTSEIDASDLSDLNEILSVSSSKMTQAGKQSDDDFSDSMTDVSSTKKKKITNKGKPESRKAFRGISKLGLQKEEMEENDTDEDESHEEMNGSEEPTTLEEPTDLNDETIQL